MTLREEVALALLNDDRVAAGWPAVVSRDGIENSDGYLRNATAAIAIVLERAAGVAESWTSSLKPGSMDRLNGHIEARRDIANAIRTLAEPTP